MSDSVRRRHRDLLAARLRFIRLAQQHIGDASDMLRSAVDDARAGGATWEQIGDALGINSEAARKRYTRKDTQR